MSHHDTGQTGRVRTIHSAVHPTQRPGIMDIHKAADEIVRNGGGDEPDGYIVTVETLDVLWVRAPTVEEALAKAITGNPDGSDFDIECLKHDIHACLHSGDEIDHDHDDEPDEE